LCKRSIVEKFTGIGKTLDNITDDLEIDVIAPNNTAIITDNAGSDQPFGFTPDTNGVWTIHVEAHPSEGLSDVDRLVTVSGGPIISATNGTGGISSNIPLFSLCDDNCGAPATLPWYWEITADPNGPAASFADTGSNTSILVNPSLDATREGVHETSLIYTDSNGRYGVTTLSITVGP